MGDDFFIQPQIEINMGAPATVYAYVNTVSGMYTYHNPIGKIETGQFFTRMGRRPFTESYYGTRVIFTDNNGLAAYGYVDTPYRDAPNPPPELNITDPFYTRNFDPETNSLVIPEGLYTNPGYIVFVVTKPLKAFTHNDYYGILPVGTELYIEKTEKDGYYYGFSVGGVNFPSQMAFNKLKLPGGSIIPFDLNNPYELGWVDLGYSYGSISYSRAIY